MARRWNHPVWGRFNEWDHRRMRAAYYALVLAADHYVGTVLNVLDELKLWDNTLVVFTSDHGEQLGEHGLYSKSVSPRGIGACPPDGLSSGL